MYELKTKVTNENVLSFLEGFKEEDRYPDLLQLVDLMQTVSGSRPKMWGTSIVGFGSYSYEGKSTRGEWFYIGFSPRKQNISIYAISGFEEEKELMSRMGKYKAGKSCLYVKQLSDIDVGVLKEFLKSSMAIMNKW